MKMLLISALMFVSNAQAETKCPIPTWVKVERGCISPKLAAAQKIIDVLGEGNETLGYANELLVHEAKIRCTTTYPQTDQNGRAFHIMYADCYIKVLKGLEKQFNFNVW